MAETRYIVAGNLIDGSGDVARRNIFLAVKNTLITAIGPAADLPRNKNAIIDDLSHCTIVPPLVDCSVNLTQSPSLDSRVLPLSNQEGDPARKTTLLEQQISYNHAHGVLGVANNDDPGGLIKRYQHETAPPGAAMEIRNAGQICRGRKDIPTDSDFLKIDYSGNIDDQQSPAAPMSLDELRRSLQQRGDKKAVVIANGRQQVEEALAAGCDAIEQGYKMGEENLRAMAKQNVLWIPNLLRAKNGLDGSTSGGSVCCRFSQRYIAPGKANPEAAVFWKKTLANQLAQLRLARELGVTTAVGTGAGNIGIIHGESMVEELKLLITAGYSLAEAIRCGSENGARFFGMEKLGALTVGRHATFLVTRGSVHQLPRKLSYLEGIYVDGAPGSAYRKNPINH